MHIVESGKRYRIFNNAIPRMINYHQKLIGWIMIQIQELFSLLEAHDFEIPETKIYGQHLDKVKKVLNAMDKMNRNLGVILSGDKGIGKSLFSKCLGLKARKKGYLLYWLMNIMRESQTFLKKLSKQS